MEENSLREWIEVIIKRRNIVGGIAIFFIVLSLILSIFVISPVYETQMVLMASNFSDRVQSNNLDNSNISNILDSLSQYPSMTLETYRQQIKSPRVMRETISDLGLEDEFDIEKLSKSIILETIRDTNLITIKMRHYDSDKAAQIVNKVGENFVNFVSSKAQEHASKSSNYVESQMEIEKEKLELALDELREFLSEPRGVSELKLELDVRLEQITEYKRLLTDFNIRREAISSAVKVAQDENKDESRIIIKEQYTEENTSFGNTGRIILESTETMLKIELAEVNSNIVQLEKHIGLLQKKIEDIQIELQDKVHQERLINQRVTLAQNTYDAFVRKYEELRVAESSQVGDATITVISRAFPTHTPVGPKTMVNLAIASLIGPMLGICVAFFIEYWKRSGTKKNSIHI